jgi:hypothetical protein
MQCQSALRLVATLCGNSADAVDVAAAKDRAQAAAVSGWVECAVEGGQCDVPSKRNLRYGANGTYAYKTVIGTIACNNSVWGDPLCGVFKACAYAANTAAAPPPVTLTQISYQSSAKNFANPERGLPMVYYVSWPAQATWGFCSGRCAFRPSTTAIPTMLPTSSAGSAKAASTRSPRSSANASSWSMRHCKAASRCATSAGSVAVRHSPGQPGRVGSRQRLQPAGAHAASAVGLKPYCSRADATITLDITPYTDTHACLVRGVKASPRPCSSVLSNAAPTVS